MAVCKASLQGKLPDLHTEIEKQLSTPGKTFNAISISGNEFEEMKTNPLVVLNNSR